MYLSTLLLVIFLLSLLCPLTSSIIPLGGTLILTAMTSTLLVALTSGSWFGFILFLIYITGLLVLFSYMMAMSPNNFNSKVNKINKLIVISISLLTILQMKSTNQLTPMNATTSFEESVTQMYSNMNLTPYWLMAIILLITLLMSVNLCYKAPKPLRSFLE